MSLPHDFSFTSLEQFVDIIAAELNITVLKTGPRRVHYVKIPPHVENSTLFPDANPSYFSPVDHPDLWYVARLEVGDRMVELDQNKGNLWMKTTAPYVEIYGKPLTGKDSSYRQLERACDHPDIVRAFYDTIINHLSPRP